MGKKNKHMFFQLYFKFKMPLVLQEKKNHIVFFIIVVHRQQLEIRLCSLSSHKAWPVTPQCSLSVNTSSDGSSTVSLSAPYPLLHSLYLDSFSLAFFLLYLKATGSSSVHKKIHLSFVYFINSLIHTKNLSVLLPDRHKLY